MALSDGVSLLQFLASIRGSGGDIKRDMDIFGSDEVRVMTIHGAKGLEAPIVILPDMLKSRSVTQVVSSDSLGRAVYWMPSGTSFKPQFITNAKATIRDLEQQEATRLLYVALTRACEGLVIAGWEKSHGVRTLEGSDYALVKSVMAKLPGVIETDSGDLHLYTAATQKKGTVFIDQTKQQPCVSALSIDSDWITEPAPVDTTFDRPLRPSNSGFDHIPFSFKSSHDGQGRLGGLAYGRMAHQLLEILPSVSEERRYAVAQTILQQGKELSKSEVNDLLQQVIGIIEMPELAPLFGKQALAEVPINGQVNKVVVAGQIDRLYVGDDHIILADFKTGQRPVGPPPTGYIEQIALYDALLSQIYSGRNIACWLVWTQTQFVEKITIQQRQQALERVFAYASAK